MEALERLVRDGDASAFRGTLREKVGARLRKIMQHLEAGREGKTGRLRQGSRRLLALDRVLRTAVARRRVDALVGAALRGGAQAARSRLEPLSSPR